MDSDDSHSTITTVSDDNPNQNGILLTDIEDFINENGRNPMENANDMEEFFNGWSVRGVVFNNVAELDQRLEGKLSDESLEGK
ncbi:hypothetical protein Hanom_Chr04g00361841 [Helianthus anomalus]